jgi:hypothetical protein
VGASARLLSFTRAVVDGTLHRKEMLSCSADHALSDAETSPRDSDTRWKSDDMNIADIAPQFT